MRPEPSNASPRAAVLLAALLSLVPSACHLRNPSSGTDADAQLEEALAQGAMLLADTPAPVFFASSEPAAPALGFGGADAKLVIREDPSENGRTPVRVLGRLHLEAYVPDECVELYAQENAPVEGTALVLRAGDRVHLVGARSNAQVHRIAAYVPLGAQRLGPFEGLVPAAALSAKRPRTLTAPPSGMSYRVPASTALPLYAEPRGAFLSLLPPQAGELSVTVLALENSWSLVRIGSGPFLQGFTNTPLTLIGKAHELIAPLPPRAQGEPTEVPWRIAQNPGVLMRVDAGTQVRFRGRIVATFRSQGWARTLSALGEAEVEVLAAVDDQVTVRGIVPRLALTEVAERAVGVGPVVGLGSAFELGSARLR